MHLSAFLSKNGLTYAKFGRLIGTRHARTVERYAKRHQKPNAEMMHRIFQATGGEVSANDFFDLDEIAPIKPERTAA